MKLNKVALVLGLSLATTYTSAETTIDLTDKNAPDVKVFTKAYPGYELYLSQNFYDTNGKITVSALKIKKSNKRYDKFYGVSISNDQTGKQRLYIGMLDKHCKKDNDTPNKSVLNIEGVNVKMTYFCGGDGHGSYTPTSDEGSNFLVDNFKRKNTVRIKLDSLPIFFEATGFTKAWNKHGGDAI